jgi:hypothetical protein
VVVTFPFALDFALLHRTIGVASDERGDVRGTIEVGSDGMSWRFVPDVAWPPGAFRLNVASVLEDPAGNRINQAFETIPGRTTTDDEWWPVPFVVRTP